MPLCYDKRNEGVTMLKKLFVKNFAIIEDLKIEFNQGMTVLTGETGAGKSLLIDTIQLLLGGRADTDMIRYGESQATIVGSFSCHNEKIHTYLKDMSIPFEDNVLEIKREIKITGKNNIFINGINVSLMILKNIAIHLADLHVQNDTYKLFQAENYLDFIDPKEDTVFNNLMNKYTMSLAKYQDHYKTYQYIIKNQNKTKEKLEFLKYEIEELKALNLSEDIDIKLEEEIKKLRNFDKIFQNLSEAHHHLENEVFSIDAIYDAATNFGKISEYSEEYQGLKEKLTDIYYVLDETKNIIAKDLRNMDFDEDELNTLEEQHLRIEKAKAKYKKNVKELILYLNEITLQVDMVEDYDYILQEKYDLLGQAYKNLCDNGRTISDYRRKLALIIEKSIIKECQELELAEIDFKIEFEEIELNDPLQSSLFTEYGFDKVDFKISLNKGEPRKSLSKVASGGEMSRIMLAFKTYFAKTSKLELMVFDEIDTGISGVAAAQIAKKMKQISLTTQVLCITHLPQVAAIGDYHYFIYKVLEGDRTKTHLDILEYDDRIEQLAIMLSGNKISKYALEHARELLVK